MFPNPVNEMLNITFSKPITGDVVVNLYDGLGKLLQSENVSGNNLKIPWIYTPGVYNVEIRMGESVYSTKVVKM